MTGDVVYPSVAAVAGGASARVVDGTARVELAAQSTATPTRCHPCLPAAAAAAAARRLRRTTASVGVKPGGLGRRHQHEVHGAQNAQKPSERRPTTHVDRYVCMTAAVRSAVAALAEALGPRRDSR